MAIVKLNRDPSPRDLRWFGILFAVFIGLFGLVAWRRWGSLDAARVIWAVAVVVPAVYYAVPGLRRSIYVGWMYLVYPVGLVVSYAVLALVYFGVITPVGSLLRVFGRDPLQRAPDPARASYWVEHSTGDDAARYFKQF
jgi:hypothetical protein